MAIAMLLTATDLASVVVADMAATYDSSMLSMADSTELVSAYLVSAEGDVQAVMAAFGEMGAVVDESSVSFDASVSAVDALSASLVEDTAMISALNEEIVALQAQLDILTASEEATAASTEFLGISMKDLAAAQTLVVDTGGLLAKLKGPAMIAGLAVVGVGIAAIKMAGDFQSSMLKVQAYVGMTQQQTQAMGQSILQMAPELGVAPKALADSLYFVASAGFKGADALTVLRYAGMTAAASNTDASVTGFALVASLNALGLKADQAGNISDELNATVKNGVMTWQQYGAVVGKIAGSVSSAGGNAQMLQHNFTALNAALDVYSNAGISAHQASMWLNADMSVLYGKAGSLATNAKKLKVSFDANAYASMDFAQRLQYLNQITGGNHQELVKLVGGNSQVANSVAFLNAHYGSLSSTIASINGTMQHGKSTQDMFAIASQGLNFQLEKAKSAGQAFLITLGTELLPIFSRLIANIIPVISNLMQWEQKTHAIQNAVLGLVGAIGNIISFGANLVAFFQHNQTAMIALGVALTIAAGVIGGLMVAAFVAWAIAAWNAAVATIAATWPIMLIGAAIALLVVGIILLVQHWGQVVSFLRGVWQSFASWFMSALHAVGAFFASIWNSVASFFVGVWNKIIGFLRAAWAVILNVIKVGAIALLLLFTWPIVAIVALFLWLYNHNYYFKAMIDAIVNFVKAGVAWLMSTWQSITSWIADKWHWLVLIATIVFMMIYVTIQARIRQVQAFLVGIWNNIVSFLSGIWKSITSKVGEMWTAISTFFGNAWSTYVQRPLQNLWANILGFINGWPKQMVQFGISMIQGFINGMLSMIGNVGKAAGQIMSNVAKFLGFHSPSEEGEGRHIVEWGYNMVGGFVGGMQSAMPLLNTQISHMIQAPNSVAYGHSGTSAGNNFGISGGHTIIVQVQPAKADINMDSKKVGEGVMKYAAKEIRIQGNVRNR